MINSEIIIKYTNALYSTPPEYSPRYDEFRDMFSSGQIRSKEWVVDELRNVLYDQSKVIIVGAWYGTLGMLIHSQLPQLSITLLDKDDRCKKFIDNVAYDISEMCAITADMFQYNYTEDIIINTSCEHIGNVRDWLSLIPHGKIVVLQSNNYLEGNGHVNCVNSVEDFIKQVNLTTVLYTGSLELPMYTRYMLIGIV